MESATPRWTEAEAWRVSTEPVVVIGNEEGPEPYLLYRVQAALLLPEGGVVVASAGSYDVRYYSADGTHVRTVGGRGQGPGEFEWPRWMSVIDEGILVWDGPNSRVHVFSDRGDLIRTTAIDPTIPPTLSGDDGFPGRPLVIGAFPDAALVVTPAFPTSYLTSRSNGTHRVTTPLIRYSAEGRAVAHIADIEGDEHAVHDGSSMHLPFGHRFLAAIAADRIFVGSGKPYDILVTSSTGDEMGLIRKTQAPSTLDAAQRQEFRDRFLARVSTVSRVSVAEELDSIEFPVDLPSYDSLMADCAGNLWARDFKWPRVDAPNWSVFSPTGEWLGTVRFPSSFEVTDIGSSLIVGLAEDEMGVEKVVVHRLIKPMP